MKYISKDAVIAEIERLKECNREICGGNLDFLKKAYPEHYYSTEIYNDILSFLDTLEVKEVDLEDEFDEYLEKQNAFIVNGNGEIKCYNGDSLSHVYDIYPIAKHFFELGLNYRKENKL